MSLVLIALLLTLHLPANVQAGSLTCTVRQSRTGQVCWCKAQRPGSRWQTYSMLVCQAVNR
jgi:hypothetical protein